MSNAVTLPAAPSEKQCDDADGNHLLYPPRHTHRQILRRRRHLSGKNIAILLSRMSGPLPVNLPAVKIKVKVALEKVTKAQRGSRSMALLFH